MGIENEEAYNQSIGSHYSCCGFLSSIKSYSPIFQKCRCGNTSDFFVTRAHSDYSSDHVVVNIVCNVCGSVCYLGALR